MIQPNVGMAVCNHRRICVLLIDGSIISRNDTQLSKMIHSTSEYIFK